MKIILKVIIPIITFVLITLILCYIFLKPNILMQYTKPNIAITDLTKNENKSLLKINHNIDFNFEPNDLVKVKSDNIKIGELFEVETKVYENEEYLDPVVKYIKDNFNIEINYKWSFTIKFNSDNGGMIYFEYFIGEIKTNKAINFGFNDGIINDIYYKCLDYEVNEEGLTNRFIKFIDKYHQEEVVLRKGEEKLLESTEYVYFYNAEKLVYSYLFHSKYLVEGQERYNVYQTSYLIDEVGNAVK